MGRPRGNLEEERRDVHTIFQVEPVLLFTASLMQLGYSRKFLPSPIQEVVNKIFSWISRILDRNSYFHTDFQIKIHKGTQNPDFLCFLTMDFQEKLVINQVGFQTFCIRGTDIFYRLREGTIYLDKPIFWILHFFTSDKVLSR